MQGAGVASSARREERVSRSVHGRYLHCTRSRYIFPSLCCGKTLELTGALFIKLGQASLRVRDERNVYREVIAENAVTTGVLDTSASGGHSN